MTPAHPRRAPGAAATLFRSKLIANQWLISLFQARDFEELAQHLRNEELEGLDENNVSRFHHALVSQFFNLPDLPADLLLEFDQNIVGHTRGLNERRARRGERPIVWKYFQYLALLFTEIYLDRYFRDPAGLLASLNERVSSYNSGKPDPDKVTPFEEVGQAWSQLNKVSYWCATGSGKTLLMHANILQYQFYCRKYARLSDLDRVILLTPNEGLSRQHLRELEASGIPAELFRKDGRGLFTGQTVEVIDIHKLKDEMGDKTVAIEAFEGNNLVLVDEGHRGATSGEEGTWMRFRNALCESGFSFEYSATFGQAVKANRTLVDLYAKNILVDYSYPRFYADGFGKDYEILNLDAGTQGEDLETYLVAALLSFFQQLRLYGSNGGPFRPFLIERPLWIFVGSKVTATLAAKDASDIVEVLRFLARYLADRADGVRRIDTILKRGIVTSDGANLLAGRFSYLNSTGLSASQLFDETLATVFNAPGGGSLYVENLRGASGEVALRVGDNDPFGLINVGDDKKLIALCDARDAGGHPKFPELTVSEREFSGSLFDEIDRPHSTVKLLIGSKKFNEGWNSWRVSTMGLLNVGATEGSQIIQLFGRGVRLKGYGYSLKRSTQTILPEDLRPPDNIGLLETLGIFGIHADYMAQFRDFLAEEGLPGNNGPLVFSLPVIANLGTHALKTIRLSKQIDGYDTTFVDAFRRLGPVPSLVRPDPVSDPSTEYLRKNRVVLNWYPKIRALKSIGLMGVDATVLANRTHLTEGHLAFLDFAAIYDELQTFKAERGWHNLNIPREVLRPLLLDQSWYELLIPADEMAFDSFGKVALWHEVAASLLKKYAERYYSFRRREWELPHLEYQDLTPDDPNLLGAGDSVGDPYYRILLDRSQDEIVLKLEELRTLIQAGRLDAWEFRGLKAVSFDGHLYTPLLGLDSRLVAISPTPLNKGEREFIEDLKAFHESGDPFLDDKRVFVLRNQSRGRGVGFFEAGNFHPDFMIWLVHGDRQHVVFVDPKGIRNLGQADPKIQFYKTIKEIEIRLADPSIRLESFIVSNTPSYTMASLWGIDKAAMTSMHILFREEDRATYVNAMLHEVVAT